MPIFQRIDITETELPLRDPCYIKICNTRNLDLLLDIKIYDSFSVVGKNLLGFLVLVPTAKLTQATDKVNKGFKRNIFSMDNEEEYPATKRALDLWVATDLFIKGILYLDGKIIINKGKDILVGVYSYQEHKNGFIWGHDLRNRCVPL